MFLAHRVTPYSISLPHTVVLGRRSREPQEEETVEGHRTAKRQLIENIQDEIRYVARNDLWRRVDSEEALDSVSRSSLTKLLAAAESLKHLTKDTLFSRPDYASQT